MASISRILRAAQNSSSAPYCPERGDIIALDFDPQAGSEQAGKRPALVLSPKRYNALARLAFVCPITSKVKGYPFEVLVPDGLALPGGIGLADPDVVRDGHLCGVALADHGKSLSWEARSSVMLCRAPDAFLAQVKAKLTALLDL